MLDVAKMNYRQLGGVLDEDQKKHEEERESARSVKEFVYQCTGITYRLKNYSAKLSLHAN